jgi:hypothetical protein
MQNPSRELQPSQLGPPSAADENQRPPSGSPSGADEDRRPPPGSSTAADENLRPPAALPSPPQEPQPPAPQSASPEIQGNGRRRRGKNGGATADAPSNKRRKVERQVDGAGLNRRRSNRDRRPTKKAAEVG